MGTESPYDLLRRGESFLKSRHPQQAAVVLERARRQEPGRSSIREALGRAYYNSGWYDKAASEFSYVVENHPTNAYAHYCLGRCGVKLGDELMTRRHFRLARAFGYEWD